MNKVLALFLSISFFGGLAQAQQDLFRARICGVGNKVYTVFTEKGAEVKAGLPYAVFERDLSKPGSMAESLMGTFTPDLKTLQFPTFWRPRSIPGSACVPAFKKFAQSSQREEVIRDFYVKAYFIMGEPRPIDNIDDMVKNGSAIPLKVRILCRSEEVTDDVSLCDQVTLLDEVIPL